MNSKAICSLLLFAGLPSLTWALSIGEPITFGQYPIGLYTKNDFINDWAVKPTNSSGQGSRLYIEPDPTNASGNVLRVTYLANAVGGSSAMAFTAPLNGQYTTLIFQYDVLFPTGFTWVKGGKLPGLTSADSPTGCIQNTEFDGFSARYMWRENGKFAGYLYNPIKENVCGDYYYPSPSVYFTAGQWYTLKQEVHIGDTGVANGYINIWVNGSLILTVQNILLRNNADTFIDQVKMDTFFGGSSTDWAPTTEQYIYFNNFQVFLSPDPVE